MQQQQRKGFGFRFSVAPIFWLVVLLVVAAGYLYGTPQPASVRSQAWYQAGATIVVPIGHMLDQHFGHKPAGSLHVDGVTLHWQ